MVVLVFEDNLMWSSRLVQSLRALGHEPILLSEVPHPLPAANAAIVNLGSTSLPGHRLAPLLHAAGIAVIAHAGHKEKDLLKLGRKANVEVLATNSELTHKLPELLVGLERS